MSPGRARSGVVSPSSSGRWVLVATLTQAQHGTSMPSWEFEGGTWRILGRRSLQQMLSRMNARCLWYHSAALTKMLGRGSTGWAASTTPSSTGSGR